MISSNSTWFYYRLTHDFFVDFPGVLVIILFLYSCFDPLKWYYLMRESKIFKIELILCVFCTSVTCYTLLFSKIIGKICSKAQLLSLRMSYGCAMYLMLKMLWIILTFQRLATILINDHHHFTHGRWYRLLNILLCMICLTFNWYEESIHEIFDKSDRFICFKKCIKPLKRISTNEILRNTPQLHYPQLCLC